MKYKHDKGMAGLSVLLSVIVLLFMIGLIVMIFTLMGTGLRDATYTETRTTVTNESVVLVAGSDLVATSSLRGFTSFNVTRLMNCTTCALPTNNTLVEGVDYVLGANGSIQNKTFVGNPLRATYVYTWDADNTATDTMNDTYQAVGGVTDWFDIFIVISAMVVLILLVVIIVTAIKGSGLVEGGNQTGANRVGTA
jgi:uncharacterized membrane protein